MRAMRIAVGDGITLACRIDGPEDAPALMLANSLGTNMQLWEPQLTVLAARFRVLRYDMRGHGGSDVPAGDHSLERLARDALDLLDALGIHRTSFAGVSLGGMVGQWLGACAPDRIAALALCNTSAYMGPPQAWEDRIALVRAEGTSAVASSVIERWFTPSFLNRAPETVSRTREMLLATAAEGYAGCCAAVRDMDLREMISRIDAPTLVIGGTYDPATPPSHAEQIAAAIRGARLVMLPAAHLSNLEQPDEFTALLLDFFTGAAARP